MFIYKITNTKNNKVYIGQTIRPIQERFKRHKTDALNNILTYQEYLILLVHYLLMQA